MHSWKVSNKISIKYLFKTQFLKVKHDLVIDVERNLWFKLKAILEICTTKLYWLEILSLAKFWSIGDKLFLSDTLVGDVPWILQHRTPVPERRQGGFWIPSYEID